MKSSKVAEIASFMEFAVVKVPLPSYHHFPTKRGKFLRVANVVSPQCYGLFTLNVFKKKKKRHHLSPASCIQRCSEGPFCTFLFGLFFNFPQNLYTITSSSVDDPFVTSQNAWFLIPLKVWWPPDPLTMSIWACDVHGRLRKRIQFLSACFFLRMP